ncbi:MAG: L-threonylcarbamoyladenylate synthase [Treponema sp.]|jgi:tRNA threonylcarbamoyl adenosine modification protein (Sua5/YciO/YrdC/YwlC family)|nr:L-threonylcarbamoyladenylate synthase [Treponema sp.]
MIEYVVPRNIDDRILRRAAHILEDGGLAAIPTDTSWSVVCSMESREGLKRLRGLSGARDEGHFTLICAGLSQVSEFCAIGNRCFRQIKRLSPGPYAFLLRTLPGTEKALGLKRAEIALRLPDHPVPAALVAALGRPLYGITAKRSMAAAWQDDAAIDDEIASDNVADLFDGGWELEAIPAITLILDPGEERERLFSTILDLRDGEPALVREGAGPWPV